MYVGARPLYLSSFSLVTHAVSYNFFNLYTIATSKPCSLFNCKGFSASYSCTNNIATGTAEEAEKSEAWC
ncbi:hypothetical protein ACSQ67_006293 [Phaseolus vulgaris]